MSLGAVLYFAASARWASSSGICRNDQGPPPPRPRQNPFAEILPFRKTLGRDPWGPPAKEPLGVGRAWSRVCVAKSFGPSTENQRAGRKSEGVGWIATW